MRNLVLNTSNVRALPLEIRGSRCILRIGECEFALKGEELYKVEDNVVSRLAEGIIDMGYTKGNRYIFLHVEDSLGIYDVFTDETVAKCPVTGVFKYCNDTLVSINADEVRIQILTFDSTYVVQTHKLYDDEIIDTSDKNQDLETSRKGDAAGKHEKPELDVASDGSFVVNYFYNGYRKLKFFDKSGELYRRVCEDGITNTTSWDPEGELLACVRQNAEGNKSIIFFNKNGWYDENLTLRLNYDVPVKSLKWMLLEEIKVLVVWHDFGKYDVISLWIRRNGLWLSKQELHFKKNDRVCQIDGTLQNSLKIVTKNYIAEYIWRLQAITSNNVRDETDNYVVIIDGRGLRLTRTGVGVESSPCPSIWYKFQKQVNFVSWSSSVNCALAVILADYSVVIVEIDRNGSSVRLPSLQVPQLTYPLAIRNFLYVGDTFGWLYAVQKDLQKSSLLRFNLRSGQINEYLNNPVEGLLAIRNQPEIALRTTNSLIGLTWNENKCSERFILNQPQLVTGAGIVVKVEDAEQVVILDQNHLYVNGSCYSTSVTSFLVSQSGYLIVTTTDDKIVCLRPNRWNEFESLLSVARSSPHAHVLINIKKNTYGVLLEGPSGITESITLCVRLIDRIYSDLQKLHFLTAYRLARKGSLNLNVLFDLQPDSFLDHALEFIRDMSPSMLTNFILSIEDVNVTYNLYSHMVKIYMNKTEVYPNKRDVVLTALINVMVPDMERYAVPLAIAYSRNNCLSKALDVVDKVRMKNPAIAEAALRLLISYNNVENLWMEALGMHRNDLVSWIGTKSNKDPLDYIPFLDELDNMPEQIRDFTVNNHIGRYKKALQALFLCDDTFIQEKLLPFINKHKLHAFAAVNVPKNSLYYNTVLEHFAKYLCMNNKLCEAATIYSKLERFEEASDLYLRANCIQDALGTLLCMPENKDQLLCFASKLSDCKSYQAAAHLYEKVGEYEMAILELLKGEQWASAFGLTVRSNRKHFITQYINPAIKIEENLLLKKFESILKECETLTARLKVIRDSREQVANIVSEKDLVESQFDMMSIASTKASQYTASKVTSTASRKSKKMYRKICEVKTGSEFEDIAIMRRLHIIITDAEESAQKVRDISVHLLKNFDSPSKIQIVYGKLLETIVRIIPDIWPNIIINPPLQPTTEYLKMWKNLHFLDDKYRFPPPLTQFNWKLDSFDESNCITESAI